MLSFPAQAAIVGGQRGSFSLLLTPPGPPFDPDAQAIIDQILAVGGSLTPTGKSGINTFVGTLKAASIWAGRYRLYGFAGGTNAAHAVDWKNPTSAGNNISWNGSVTSDLNGSHGDGTSYGDIPFVANTLNPAAFALTIHSRTAGNDAGLNFGVDDGSNFIWEALNHIGGIDIISGSFSTRYTQSNTLQGQLSMEVSGGNRDVYFNGSLIHSDTPTVTLPSLNFWCFGRNDNGSLADGNTKNLCLIDIGDPMGATSQAIFNNAVGALRQALTGFPLVSIRLQTHNNQTSPVQVLNMAYIYGNQDYWMYGGGVLCKGLSNPNQSFSYESTGGTWQFTDSANPSNTLTTDSGYPGVDPTEVTVWYVNGSTPVHPTLTLVNRSFADTVGLYQDTGLTTPATSLGDPIAAWADVLGGSGIVATQSNSTKQPTLQFVQRVSDGVYVPRIKTDGVDDRLSAAFSMPSNSPGSAFLKARAVDATQIRQAAIWLNGWGSNSGFIFSYGYDQASPDGWSTANTDPNTADYGLPQTNSDSILSVTFDGSTTAFFFNSSQVFSLPGLSFAGGANTLTIGGVDQGGWGAAMEAEFTAVFIMDRAATPSERMALENYMATL